MSAGGDGLRLDYGGNGLALSGLNGQILTNEPDYLYSTGANNQIASRGYCRLNFSRTTHTHGNIASDGKITATAGATPTDYYIAADASGNLYRGSKSEITPALSTLTHDDITDWDTATADFVTQNDLTDFVTQNDLTDYVTQNDLTDYVTQNDLTDYVTQNDLTDYVTQNDLTDFVTQSDLTDFVT